jgi:hypothetical protein
MLAPDFAPIASKSEDIATWAGADYLPHVNVAHPIAQVSGRRIYAIGSSHVGKDVERASLKKWALIALRIDTAPLTPALEYFVSESLWVEAQAENKESAN